MLVAGAGHGWVGIARELARDGLRFVAAAGISFGFGALVGDQSRLAASSSRCWR